MCEIQKTVMLNNGVEMPREGFGTFQLKDPEVAKLCVASAIQAGYRLIDTAAQYQNEAAVGDGIRLSGVQREKLFITTKIWLQYCGYDKVREGFENSRKRLGLEYVDLYLIHWPFVDPEGTWKAMEELVDEGKIRAIGVSNFSIREMEGLLRVARIKPVVNQVECHPVYQQRALREYLKTQDILTEAWGSLGRAKAETMQNETIGRIAEAYKKTPAQIMLRWALQEGMAVIPMSTSITRIIENKRIWDFALSDADMRSIERIDTGKRLVARTDPDSREARERLINMVLDV